MTTSRASGCATGLIAGLTIVLAPSYIQADDFGSGADVFTIDFVPVANPYNADDSVSPDGAHYFGGVEYTYRIAVTEVPQDWVDKASNLGLTGVWSGPWTGNQPATQVTWYEAAAFVNWLNTSKGHQPAYDLTFDPNSQTWSMSAWDSGQAWQSGGENIFRHKDAVYFLPNEDEWYKAAYHQNDGATGHYWIYATGSDADPLPVSSGTTPGTAVFAGAASVPADVDNCGGLSPCGTRGQNGNVWEWIESDYRPPNDDPTNTRTVRSAMWSSDVGSLRSIYRHDWNPTLGYRNDLGFRVARIACPELAGDLDGNGVVDLIDLSTLLTEFGQSGSGLIGDLDGNNVVDLIDLSMLLANFGASCG